jgi:WD40 repeat protein
VEILSYIVEAALSQHAVFLGDQSSNQMEYQESLPRVNDTLNKEISMVTVLPHPLDQLLVVESGDRDICKLYKVNRPHDKVQQSVRPTQSKLRHHTDTRIHIVTAALLVPNAALFITASEEKATNLGDKSPDKYYITQWDTKGPYHPFQKRTPCKQSISCFAYCSNPQMLFCGTKSAGGSDGTSAFIIGRNVKTLAPVMKLKWHTEEVTNLIIVNSSFVNTLISGAKDGTICLWNTEKGTIETHPQGGQLAWMAHDRGVKHLAKPSKMDLVASLGYGTTVEKQSLSGGIWSTKNGSLLRELIGHEAPASGIAVNDIAKFPHLITADISGHFLIWELENFTVIQSLNGSSFGLTSLKSFALLLDRSQSVKAGEECNESQIVAFGNSIRVFSLEFINPPQPPLIYTKFNRTSLTFITATCDGISIWDACTGKLLKYYDAFHLTGDKGVEITSVCLDHRRRRFICGSSNGALSIHSYSNGVKLQSLDKHTNCVSGVVYSTPDKSIISSSWDSSFQILMDACDTLDPGSTLIQRKVTITDSNPPDIGLMLFNVHLNIIVVLLRNGCLPNSVIAVFDFEFASLMYLCVPPISSKPQNNAQPQSKTFITEGNSPDKGQNNSKKCDVVSIAILGNYPAMLTGTTMN